MSGTVMFMFFVILSGVRDVTPFNKTWFLQVDTSDLSGSRRPLTQWTYFFICSAQNKNCGSPVPALPIGYGWPGGSLDVPRNLVGSFAKNTTSRYFYYMWRFGWVSYLIGLVFVSLGWFVALLSVWTRLGSAISALLVAFGLFWHTIAASLMTSVLNHLH
ncbi:Protein SUR7 [Golovinomyces cichoracearum]|uniref:Protein SUR7 n=1 Tax=Golovinomyces cichoracearum TaxID=62708 RepID=A0A420HKA6_9PEZI|nr:Protein SUR7 [Golovinomyces cichoracearum]